MEPPESDFLLWVDILSFRNSPFEILSSQTFDFDNNDDFDFDHFDLDNFDWINLDTFDNFDNFDL